MTPEQFCYWLQGYVELYQSNGTGWTIGWTPTADQWKSIKEHLNTVFNKITPSLPGYDVFPAGPPLAPYFQNPPMTLC